MQSRRWVKDGTYLAYLLTLATFLGSLKELKMKVLTITPKNEGLLISNIGKNLDFEDVIDDLRGFTAFPTEHFLKVTRVEITVVLNTDLLI